MAAVFTLFLIVLTAFSFSVIVDKDLVDMLPVSIFSAVLYLYIFYCANLLQIGIVSLYLLIAALLFFAIFRTAKSKQNPGNKITPAFVIFICTSLFFLLYTADNLSINWDELRVWSAMPKAIYETKQLQLGPQALIFDSGDNMQTYPPALPLFSVFLLGASPVFVESYLFLAYAVFVSAITILPFHNLRWKHWWLMPAAFVFVTCVPFVLTLHGGDSSYFYESLYIDPVLGFAAGYVFYLATSNPFRSRFSRIRFALALGILVIMKDTGIVFGLLSLLCALLIRCFEEKTPASTLVRDLIAPSALMFFAYFLWKGLLQCYSITNHVSLRVKLPAPQVLRALADVLLHAPIINLIVCGISFLMYCLILFLGCVLIEKLTKRHSKANNLCALTLTVLSFLLFAFGYISIFPYSSAQVLLDLSYYRYFTTLTSAYLIFCFLRYLPDLLERIPALRRTFRVPAFAAALMVCLFSTFVLCYWQTDYSNLYSDFLPLAEREKARILEEIPVDNAQEHQRVYLLMAEKEPNIFHHRFYFELIGTGLNIENFYIDTDMYDALGVSPDPVETAAEKWYARLQADAYDYIYVYSVNESIAQAFSHLGLGEALAGCAYPVIH